MSDRISRAFNRSGATRVVALDISKAFDRVWHAGILHKLTSCRVSGQIFGLISSFLTNRRLWMVLDGKSSQQYLNKGKSGCSALHGVCPNFLKKGFIDYRHRAIYIIGHRKAYYKQRIPQLSCAIKETEAY